MSPIKKKIISLFKPYYMPTPNHDSTISGLVNYTNLTTEASNELYVAATESPESTAFLIRNGIIIEYSLIPVQEDDDASNKEISKIVSILFHTI